MNVVGLYVTPACEKLLLCLEAVQMLLTLCIAFLSPIFHMWSEKGIYFNLLEEEASLFQIAVLSERVPHLTCV